MLKQSLNMLGNRNAGITCVLNRCFSTMSKTPKPDLESEIQTYYGASDHNDAYHHCWGESNIHIGYFPHLERGQKTSTNQTQAETEKVPKLQFKEAAQALTKQMGTMANIDKNCRVIDFGCGMGGPAIDLVQTFGATVTGLDLTQEHIDSCKITGEENGIDESQLNFIQGSFVDLPDTLYNSNIKYSHCFSQMAVYHVSNFMDKVVGSAYHILEDDGILIWNDFTGQDVKPSNKCLKHFYQRLHLNKLVSDGEYIQLLTQGGFEIIHYEMIGQHVAYGYTLLEKAAREKNFISEDGTLLADHYKATAEIMYDKEVGANLVVARKKSFTNC